MGQLKVEKKLDKCQDCKKKFSDELPYQALNRCRKCYYNFKQPRKGKAPRLNSISKWTHCLECKFQFGTLGYKDKLVTYGSSGLCKRCYQRLYNRKLVRECQKCGKQIKGSTKPLCSVCYDIERDNFYKGQMRSKQPKSYKEKLKIIQTEISDELFETITRLFVRYKLGMISAVDPFRVASAYVEIYQHEAHLDAYPEDEQVVIMLKRLKEIWEWNKVYKAEKRLKEKIKLQTKIKKLIK